MVKVGILGTGFGKYHAELYKKIDGFEIVSIFGRNVEKLNQIGKELNVNTTSNIDEIVKNPDIDLLDICLPTDLHSKWAIEGLKNKKHIFCETPITYNVNEADEIRQTSQKYGKNVFVDLFIKFSPPHNTAIKYSKEGTLGSLMSIKAYNSTSPRWGDLGLKNILINFHNHLIDFACEITGMPESVIASGMDLNGKSVVTTTFQTKDHYAVLESNSILPDSCPFSIGFELVFSKGLLRYDAIYGEYTEEKFIIFENGKSPEILKLDEKDDYEESFRHILQCIQNNTKSSLLDINAAIDTVKVKDMILMSLNKNQ
jgi:predicted dehydrogenase